MSPAVFPYFESPIADSGYIEESYFDIDEVREHTGSGAIGFRGLENVRSERLLAITVDSRRTCNVTSRLSMVMLTKDRTCREERALGSRIAPKDLEALRPATQQLKPKPSTSHLSHPKNLIDGKQISIPHTSRITSNTSKQ